VGEARGGGARVETEAVRDGEDADDAFGDFLQFTQYCE
jgi:hypothetical protein